ncbi:cytidine deaminase-like protein [Biscogniauxia mediterranea]|nr:cytidine deaminase-like protein [Biscogniauxia mediterranea]
MQVPEPPPITTTTNTTTNTHTPSALLRALLSTIEEHVVPLTAAGVSSGSKVFGAAVLSGADLAPLTAATNDERWSPLLHGEVNCIQAFFAQGRFPAPELSLLPSSGGSGLEKEKKENGNGNEKGAEGEEEEEKLGSERSERSSCYPYPLGSGRPSPRSCVFLATHEPCSLCLSALAWAGFATVYYLFAHADSRDLFAIPYDIDILEAVFRVPSPSPSPSSTSSPTSSPASSSTTKPERDGNANANANADGHGHGRSSSRPLYNRTNKFFTARSLAELAAEVPGADERRAWEAEIARVRALYDGLNERYQQGKREGVGSASFWK